MGVGMREEHEWGELAGFTLCKKCGYLPKEGQEIKSCKGPLKICRRVPALAAPPPAPQPPTSE